MRSICGRGPVYDLLLSHRPVPSHSLMARSTVSKSACGPSAPFRPVSSFIRHERRDGAGGSILRSIASENGRLCSRAFFAGVACLPPARLVPSAVLRLVSSLIRYGGVTRAASSITRRFVLLSARSI